MRCQFFRRAKRFSIRRRCLQGLRSCRMGLFHPRRTGMQVAPPLVFRGFTEPAGVVTLPQRQRTLCIAHLAGSKEEGQRSSQVICNFAFSPPLARPKARERAPFERLAAVRWALG